MIERQITIGLITSTEFIQRIHDKWNVRLIASPVAKRIATWCMEYYSTYSKAPGKEIETIFYQKARNGLSKELVEEIEEDILPGLSEEYEQGEFNVDYLVDETLKYFSEQNLKQFSDDVKALAENGQIIEAERLALSYKPVAKEQGNWVELSDANIVERVQRAFNRTSEPLIYYPKQLGEFWNDQMTRESFVAFLAPEKRGKTFLLLDAAMRGCRQKRRVAFFQAGDMTEDQQLIRIAIYLAKKSNKEKYSGKMFEPVLDCVHNQLDTCDRAERECDFGLFGKDKSEKFVREEVTMQELEELYPENLNYRTCTNCKKFSISKWGCIWIKSEDTGLPLTAGIAAKKIESYFVKYKRQFKLSTHANGTLTVKQIKAILDIWEKNDGFIPDVIIVDYADLLEDDSTNDFRHKQNEIWKGLRSLSQTRHALVMTATQADAQSYSSGLLKLSNFSEDKRKYAHVTAMWGLNQSPDGREKKLGLMRINELIKREGDFEVTKQIHILQNLKRGRPILGSYI